MAIVLDGNNLQTTGVLNSFTAKDTSTGATSYDFTGIPAGTKRITVTLSGVKISGGADIQIQVGTSSGITTSGYLNGSTRVSGATPATTNYSTGFGIDIGGGTNTNVHHGSFVLTYVGSNTWVVTGVFGLSNNNVTGYLGGSITTSGTLDRIRLVANNGSDTFTAGTVNVLYE